MKREREPWTYNHADRMYREDGYFRTVVDSLYLMIEHLQLTPAELRAAATYAVVRWEMHHPRPVIVPSGMLDPDVLRELQQQPPGSLLTAAEYLRQQEDAKKGDCES